MTSTLIGTAPWNTLQEVRIGVEADRDPWPAVQAILESVEDGCSGDALEVQRLENGSTRFYHWRLDLTVTTVPVRPSVPEFDPDDYRSWR